MKSIPTVYIVNPDTVANSLTKQLFGSIDIYCVDYQTPTELLHNLPDGSPACFLLSFLLPEMSGLELMSKMRQSGVVSPCIFTSTKSEPELVVKAMHAGGFGFIKKPFQYMDLVELVQKALEYDKKANRYVRIAIIYERNVNKLSIREKQVLDLLLDDLSAMKIGQKLAISHRTVENHRNNIFNKLEISKTSELMRMSSIHETVKNTGFWEI